MIGETFVNYRVVSHLGSGAMGTVFLGEHERIARRAAIKVLAPEFAENAELLQRFFNEARATSLIHHPAIVEVLDCGVHPAGRPYIVMEYLRGETLAEVLARAGALPWPVACALARQLAEGLGAAHRHGIVHRDVKPENVMLLGDSSAPAGPATLVKLLDFGVAKLLHDTPWVARTVPGKLIGTPRYMAPEQYAGEGTIDARTDVYALGCVLFEMVCGQAPFLGERLGELINAHRWRSPPAASSLVALPAALDRLIAQMLGKRQEDRPADMAAVGEALRGLLERGGADTLFQAPAPTTPTPTPAPRGDRTRRLPRLVTAGVLAVAAGGVAAYLAHRGTDAVPTAAVTAVVAPEAASPVPPIPELAPPSLQMSVPAPVEPAPVVAAPPTAAPPATAPSGGRRLPASPRRARQGSPAEIDVDGIVEL